MASLNAVYGDKYQEQALKDKALYFAKLYATNIVHKQFSFRQEAHEMWQGNNMKSNIITALVGTVPVINNGFRVVHIPKTSNKINMFPYLIDGPVEYFVVVDFTNQDKTQLYSVYITPQEMNAY
jgi:hypothetical protein